MKRNASEEKYEVVEVLGQKCLFTCMRIDRATVPAGMYAYDIRHDDDCQGIACEIKKFVLVNHCGTIICKQPIEMTDLKELGENMACRIIDEEKDFLYIGEYMTLEEYAA